MLTALQYLTVNHRMIGMWDNDFIPSDLRGKIVSIGLPDSGERERYSIHLDTGNLENDFQATQDTNLEASFNAPLMTRFISTGSARLPERPSRSQVQLYTGGQSNKTTCLLVSPALKQKSQDKDQSPRT